MSHFLGLVVAATIAAHTAPALAQQAIAPQPLAQALDAWARQTGLQVIYGTELTRGLTSPGAPANADPREALEKILEGSGLKVTWLNERTASIGIAQPAAAPKPTANTGPASVLRLAQTSSITPVDGPATDASGTMQSSAGRISQGEWLEEIIVTGSRMGEASRRTAQDVQTYNREQIQRSGQLSVGDFLNTLPSVSLNTADAFSGYNFSASTVRLRGLPVGTTLVLIDGRRVQTSGSQAVGNFFDLNNIPMATVERIDVVADGASAIYGSDAIAGVVNVILKKDFEGVDVSARYGSADSTDELNVNLAWGMRGERGHLSIVGGYQERSGLLGAERALTKSNDYTSYGGPNNNYPVCNPGNVFFPNGYSFDGGPPVDFAAIPAGLSGTPTVEDFSATAGTLNTCGFLTPYTSIVPPTQRSGVLLSGEIQLSPSVTLFGDFTYTHLRQESQNAPSFLFGLPGFQTFSMSADNPYNPFGTTVGITYAFPSNQQTQHGYTDFYRPVIGLRGRFANSWRWEVSALHSEDRVDGYFPNVATNDAVVQAALNSSDPATALNPFAAGEPGSPELMATLFLDARYKYIGRGQALNAFLRGEIASLPAGPLTVVVGGEYTRDKLFSHIIEDPSAPPDTKTTRTRRTLAFFTEARVPLLSGLEDQPERLALTLALRHDDYSDFGTTTNPQYGLEWRPLRGLLVRGTYGHAFKAPSLHHLYSPQTLGQNYFILDPQQGGAPLLTNALTGGNPNLRPEGGRSQTFGFDLVNAFVDGLRVSATHWKIKQTDAIVSRTAQFIVDNESLFPDRVTRDADGNITLIDITSLNFGTIEVAGLDYHINYTKPTAWGVWTPSLSATQTYRYETGLVPHAPPFDRASKADLAGWAPRWKGTVGLGWSRAALTAQLTGRYIGSYQDYDSTREIGNFWYVDANVQYDLGGMLASRQPWLRGARLEIGAVNLLDREPQYSNFNLSLVGYDPTQADMRGRFVYVQLGTQW